MGMLCSLDLMFKKKIIFLFLLLFSSIVIFGNTDNQTLEVCKYFKGGDSKKKFNPYTGKTNIPFKNGIYKCENTNVLFRVFILRYLYVDDLDISGTLTFEIKNGRMVKFEARDSKTGKLEFSAQYNQSGPVGEMYVDKSFGFGNENSLKLNYKNGKPVGEMEEYYDNGKLYRKSTLRKKNNFHPFSNPDDFKDYVEYYEIYDINTGEIVKKESLANKTGIIWRYNSKTGKLEMESHLENGKIFLQKEYGEDRKIIQEYNY